MQHLLKLRTQLNVAEWLIVFAIPFVMIVPIRHVAIFYVGLALILVVMAYAGTASYDYSPTSKINQKRRKNLVEPQFHYLKMLLYGLVSFMLSFMYLMR